MIRLKTFNPPRILLISAIASFLLDWVWPMWNFSSQWILGWGLIGAGTILNIYLDNLFKQAKTTIKPDQVPKVMMMTGPFKYSRNPMYLGMASVLLGLGFLVGSGGGMLPAIGFVFYINNFVIPKEEKIMSKKFGKEYKEYMRRVRRWF